MPVSVKIDPFSRQPIRADLPLRTPQARILSALMPGDPSDPVSDWPLVTRAQLGVRAGYTAISGTVTRALDGLFARTVYVKPRSGKWTQFTDTQGRQVWIGSSSGDPHPGLVARGFVEEVVLDVEGVSEVNYRSTLNGVRAYQAYISSHSILPDLKPAAICVNDRYLKKTDA